MSREASNRYARGEITLDEVSYLILRGRFKRANWFWRMLCRIVPHHPLPSYKIGREIVEICACCGKERRQPLSHGIENMWGAWS